MSCAIPVFAMMAGAAALAFGLAWFWLNDRILNLEQNAQQINTQLTTLQLERSKLIKRANELQAEFEKQESGKLELQQNVSILRESLERLEVENNMLLNENKTLESIIKDMS